MSQRTPLPPGKTPNPRHRQQNQPKHTVEEIALQNLFRARHAADDIPQIVTEIEGTSDRAACLILCSIVERELENLLIKKIWKDTPISEPRMKKIFDRDGALSTFSGNINFAFALHLFASHTKNDLDVIRRIRNLFAHSALPITFQHSKIAKEATKLRPVDYYNILGNLIEFSNLNEQRARFILSCLQVILELEVGLVTIGALPGVLMTVADKSVKISEP